jgi:hypothetical protein
MVHRQRAGLPVVDGGLGGATRWQSFQRPTRGSRSPTSSSRQTLIALAASTPMSAIAAARQWPCRETNAIVSRVRTAQSVTRM